MPQLPNSRPPRPPQVRLTQRKLQLQALADHYAASNLQLLRYLLSHDASEDSNNDGDSNGETNSDTSHLTSLDSSSLSFDMSSSPTLRSSSPISDTSSLRVRNSSVSPGGDVDEMDLLNILYNKFRAEQDQLLTTRYLNQRRLIPHNSQIDLLMWYKEHSPLRFQQKVRIAPATFNFILSLTRLHQIFQSTSIRGQIPVDIQLAIFLNRIGHYGNASSVDDIAEWAGVSSGTVINCTRRCMLAILAHHDSALAVPTDHEKNLSKLWSEEKTIPEWRNGWLAVDGTTFPLFQKPGLHGEAWFNKSSQYSMNSQFIILLNNLCIIDYSLGHTGSVHDAYAFQSTPISSDHQTFFPDGDWMWADSTYPV